MIVLDIGVNLVGCEVDTIAITVDGRFQVYGVGAPAFVNANFPTWLDPGSPYLYTCVGQ